MVGKKHTITRCKLGERKERKSEFCVYIFSDLHNYGFCFIPCASTAVFHTMKLEDVQL